jgi:hypothetical protein
MKTDVHGHRDREICRLLGTNPTEMAKALGLTRQTLAKRVEDNKLFNVETLMTVAAWKISDDGERSRVVASILNDMYPEVVRNTHDTDVGRFSRYCILGRSIHASIVSQSAFEEFLRRILSDEAKFLLFVCLPQIEHARLKRWLKDFQQEKDYKTASFVVLPSQLVEFAPMQIIADLWSANPRVITLTDHVYIEEGGAKRATEIASALMDHGLSERTCERLIKHGLSEGEEELSGRADEKEDDRLFANLLRNLNSSLCEEPSIKESAAVKPDDILRFGNPKRSSLAA